MLVLCVLTVTIGQVSAENVEVSNFNELSGNLTDGNNVVLKNNITDGIFGAG